MNSIKSKARSVKNHVYRHRAKYAVGGTSLVFLWLMTKRAEQWNDFLAEKGIDPSEFYLTPEDYEVFTAVAL